MKNQINNQEFTIVNVWDWQTRVLHWTNALLVISLALLALGFEMFEELGMSWDYLGDYLKEIHAYIGYVFIFTLTLRILWGFIGNEYARWLDIIPYKKERWTAIWGNIKWYLSGFKIKPPISIGHNPLASLFYAALFLVIISQTLTGIVLSGLEFGLAPLGSFFSQYDHDAKEIIEDMSEEVHEFGLWFIIFFFAAHMTGLLVHTIFEKTELFSSMLNGKKYFQKGDL
ncbi:MAG: cytochrome b/b6 domain-containing protein [Deltaproteobacteria bacterium]|nr:cytochrome b/b6 domain-containing protein [Deltaproteobacteria bacterium]